MGIERLWRARWINGENGRSMGTPYMVSPTPAPYMRQTFTAAAAPKNAAVWLAAPGWHELYINGRKVDDRVLSPVVTQFDRHIAYIKYDVTALIRPGKNAIAVLLGNGWYNCSTAEVWEFTHAHWRDFPKLLCEVEIDGEIAAASDASWKTTRSPIVFDSLRNGERYDARKEIPGFADPDFDDSRWEQAAICNPPGGQLALQDVEPCKVMQRYPVVKEIYIDPYVRVFDFGTNLTGWCDFTVEGDAGEELQIFYSEQLRENGNIERTEIEMFVKDGGFQEDHYFLKGGGEESWQPHFTYHGFRYVKVLTNYAKVKIKRLEACFVHSSFNTVGKFTSSDQTLNRLQQMTQQSYRSNFTGIPTDCPHREKNGWTGDANIAMETGLWNYDAVRSYKNFIQILVDCQRLSGQLPGIAPTGGWGFNCGSGPAWDSVLFETAEKIYLYCGDDELIRTHYAAMEKYISYCEYMSTGDLVAFGLGDWCHWDSTRIAPTEVTSSGYYYADVLRMEQFARMLGRDADALRYQILKARIRTAFNAKFYHPETHTYADGSQTALGTALYFGLCEEENAQATAETLAKMVRANAHKADFGILGAKFIPRVLADYGYADDAYLLLTQPEFPGWGHWVQIGATTLREMWNSSFSQNHIMFGDISAWMYQYLGGIVPQWDGAGFKRFVLKPYFVRGLESAAAEHRAPAGLIRSEWRRADGKIIWDFTVPAGAEAEVAVNGKTQKYEGGTYNLTLEDN